MPDDRVEVHEHRQKSTFIPFVVGGLVVVAIIFGFLFFTGSLGGGGGVGDGDVDVTIEAPAGGGGDAAPAEDAAPAPAEDPAPAPDAAPAE